MRPTFVKEKEIFCGTPILPPSSPTLPGRPEQGDIEAGFAEADVIKEFTYRFAGGVSVPMQPSGSVAKWDGDRLTLWGMGQGIYPPRRDLANALGIDPSQIRFINKWNGSTFGAARLAAERFYPMIAHLAKVTGRPVKIMLPKDQELAQLVIKPETITNFKVGVKRDGRITAIYHQVYVSVGELEFGVHADGPGNAFNQLELYTAHVPHWRSLWCAYRSDAPRPGPSTQPHPDEETKCVWENMIDEMAETVGIDPVESRLKRITRIRLKTRAIVPIVRFGGSFRRAPRLSVRDQRNSVAGGNAGRLQARSSVSACRSIAGGLIGLISEGGNFRPLGRGARREVSSYRTGSGHGRLRRP